MNKKIAVLFTILVIFCFGSSRQANAGLGITAGYDFFAKFVDSSGKDITSSPVVYNYGDNMYVYVYFRSKSLSNSWLNSTTLTFNGTKYVDYYYTKKVLVRNKAGETSTYWDGNKTDIPFQVNITGGTAYELNPLWYNVNFPAPTLDFYATTNPITLGNSTILKWKAGIGINSCTANTTSVGAGSWSGAKSYSDEKTYSQLVTPITAGNKTYKLSCINRVGNIVEKTVDLTVDLASLPNNSPDAVIDTPLEGQSFNAGDTIYFTGTGNDPDTGDTINYYRWNLGGCDDTFSILSSVPSFSRTFSAGAYAVYFKVMDNHNAWSTCDSRNITVAPPLPPCSNDCSCVNNICTGQTCKNECGDSCGAGAKDCSWREVAP